MITNLKPNADYNVVVESRRMQTYAEVVEGLYSFICRESMQKENN